MTFPEAIVQSAKLAADAYAYGQTCEALTLSVLIVTFGVLGGFGLYVMHKSM